MQRELFILVPSLESSGPIKGAIATANLLKSEYCVTLVSLKNHKKHQVSSENYDGINLISLASFSWVSKFLTYKNLLKKSHYQRKIKPISLSFCFSADLFNSVFSRYSTNISSIRNNLFKDYKFLYGYAGYFFAFFHALLLNFFSKVYVMTTSMSEVIESYILKKPLVIPNFIDEQFLDVYKKNKQPSSILQLVFVGSLTERKQPIQLLDSFFELIQKEIDAHLTFIGDGSLYEDLQHRIKVLGLTNKVKLMGFIKDPYEIISNLDIMVLPSLSEGISRASLESLYLGLPCVLRNIDGNSELISNEYKNGILFDSNNELSTAIIKTIELYKKQSIKENLLPIKFRREEIKKLLVEIFN